MNTNDERRYAQRINFEPPRQGTLSALRVAVVDISTSGARFEHNGPMSFQPGKHFILELECDGDQLHLPCVVARSRMEKIDLRGIVCATGVRFVGLNEGTAERLRVLVGGSVMDALAHEPADADYSFAIVNS